MTFRRMNAATSLTILALLVGISPRVMLELGATEFFSMVRRAASRGWRRTQCL